MKGISYVGVQNLEPLRHVVYRSASFMFLDSPTPKGVVENRSTTSTSNEERQMLTGQAIVNRHENDSTNIEALVV